MKDLWRNPEQDAIIERYRPQFQTIREGYSSNDGSDVVNEAGLDAAATLGAGMLILYIIIGVIAFGLFIWDIVALVHF